MNTLFDLARLTLILQHTFYLKLIAHIQAKQLFCENGLLLKGGKFLRMFHLSLKRLIF